MCKSINVIVMFPTIMDAKCSAFPFATVYIELQVVSQHVRFTHFFHFFLVVFLNCFNAKFECGCDFCFFKNICEHNAEQICKLINAN